IRSSSRCRTFQEFLNDAAGLPRGQALGVGEFPRLAGLPRQVADVAGLLVAALLPRPRLAARLWVVLVHERVDVVRLEFRLRRDGLAPLVLLGKQRHLDLRAIERLFDVHRPAFLGQGLLGVLALGWIVLAAEYVAGLDDLVFSGVACEIDD